MKIQERIFRLAQNGRYAEALAAIRAAGESMKESE